MKKILTYLNCIIMLLFAVNITILSPLLISIAKEFNLSLSKVGIIFTTNFMGFVVFILIGGVLADRFGKKKVLNVAFIGFCITTAIFALSPSFTFLLLIALFMGGFGGILECISSAYASDLNPAKATYYVNLTHVFFGVGAIVGPLTASVLVNNGYSWRMPYLLLAGVSTVIMVVFLLIKDQLEVPLSQEEGIMYDQQAPKVKVLLKQPRFILLMAAMFLYTGSEVGAWGWMATMLQQKFEFNIVYSALAVGVFWLAMTIGRFICGELSTKVPIRTIVYVLAIVASISTFLSSRITSSIGIWFIIVAMGLGYSSLFPMIISYGSELMKSSSGILFSVLIACAGFGNMIVPTLMGVLGERSGLSAVMLLPSILLMFVAIIFLSFTKSRKEVD